MIADDRFMFVLPQQPDNSAGVGAVTDEIAERPDFVKSAVAVGVIYDALEGFDVAVDVRDDKGVQYLWASCWNLLSRQSIIHDC